MLSGTLLIGLSLVGTVMLPRLWSRPLAANPPRAFIPFLRIFPLSVVGCWLLSALEVGRWLPIDSGYGKWPVLALAFALLIVGCLLASVWTFGRPRFAIPPDLR
jgi:hypothetical protein